MRNHASSLHCGQNHDPTRGQKLITDAIQSGRKSLLAPEAKAILKAWEIRVPEYVIVRNAADAVNAANTIGYPVVLKVVSPDGKK